MFYSRNLYEYLSNFIEEVLITSDHICHLHVKIYRHIY